MGSEGGKKMNYKQQQYLAGRKRDNAREIKNLAAEKAGIKEHSAEESAYRASDTQRGRQDAQNFFNQEQKGLTDAQRNAMQYEGERQIDREHEKARQALLGQQGQRGIGGKSGIGYAQQKDLHGMASEARGAVTRGVQLADADQALKKQAAIYAGGQGEATLSALDRQAAQDDLRYRQEQHEATKRIRKAGNSYRRL
jgi:hypothetical protein